MKKLDKFTSSSTPMFDAGTRFAEDFHSAGLEGIRAIDYGSAGGGSASTDSMTERVAMAQHRVGKALDAVGGIESPGGSALWGIIWLYICNTICFQK